MLKLESNDTIYKSVLKFIKDSRRFISYISLAKYVAKGPRPIGFKEWRDTRTFSNLKSTHCTLIILLIINLVTKKFK
jgi:hypothetical protein